ncbi:hypothetical protein HDU84_006779 [Entophlyctis sp. JEL0112]|nr:hypothetical protein HDU84_006779 [Entophlyctis sp. JEL0112]
MAEGERDVEMQPLAPPEDPAVNDDLPSAEIKKIDKARKPPSGGGRIPAHGVPVFASFGSLTVNPVRMHLVWAGLRLASLAILAVALLLRISDLSGVYNPSIPFKKFQRGNTSKAGLLDAQDCKKSLISGHWTAKSTWSPHSCALAVYNPATTSECLANKKVVMVGDSSMRAIFYALRRSLGQKQKDFDPEKDWKHNDLAAEVKKVHIKFFWDPWLNRTSEIFSAINSEQMEVSLAMFSAGAWFMRYGEGDANGIARFANATSTLKSMIDASEFADRVMIRLIAPFDEGLLSAERKPFLRNELRHIYNKRLFELYASAGSTLDTVALNVLTAAHGKTLDGLHFLPVVDDTEVNLLLNEVCNAKILQGKPGKGTCCLNYPYISFSTWLIFNLILIFGPVAMLCRILAPKFETSNKILLLIYPTFNTAYAIGIFGLTLFACVLEDRTHAVVKVNKEFSTSSFVVFNLLWILPGLWSMRQLSGEKDTGFLNRHQTDEWKGWMQFAILVYHWTNGSKIVPIYSVIRMLVAAYLFMTGFGHFTYFYRKKDFSLLRVARVIVRLNLLSVALSYVMRTDTLFYYFGPMVTVWFLLLWGSMNLVSVASNRFGNTSSGDVGAWGALAGIVGVVVAALVFINVDAVHYGVFWIASTVFGVRWDAREAIFRFALDRFAVAFGMFAAWISGCIETVAPNVGAVGTGFDWMMAICSSIVNRWPIVKRTALVISCVVFGVYGIVLAFVPFTKAQNNAAHPYTSLIVIAAFIVLRNATPQLRGITSSYWKWIGGFSLETFILQYHVWLGVDTYGLIDLWGDAIFGKGIDGTGAVLRLCGFFALTILFLGLSEAVAEASGTLVETIVVGALGKNANWRSVGLRLAIWIAFLVAWNHAIY